MKEWFISIVDNSEKRATLSVIVGIISIPLGLLTFVITILFYPVSALLAVAGLLMAYTSLDCPRGWYAVTGMILNGIGLLGPLVLLAVLFFST